MVNLATAWHLGYRTVRFEQTTNEESKVTRFHYGSCQASANFACNANFNRTSHLSSQLSPTHGLNPSSHQRFQHHLLIHAIWSRINLAVVRLGTVIRERWLRMNDSQRKAILLQA